MEIKELKMNISGEDKDIYLKVKGYFISMVADIEVAIKDLARNSKLYDNYFGFWEKVENIMGDYDELKACEKFITENADKASDHRDEFINQTKNVAPKYERLLAFYDENFKEEIVDGIAIVKQDVLDFCKKYVMLID
jgi:hypothetical protein